MIGYGGISLLHRVTRVARSTITRGVHELQEQKKQLELDPELDPELGYIRRQGGGRKSITQIHPNIKDVLKELVDPYIVGDPCSERLWVSRSARNIAADLRELGYNIGHVTVAKLIKEMNFTLQGLRKTKSSTKQHPDRDAQFKFIHNKTKRESAKGNPVISIDTKKTEVLGPFKTAGKCWHPKGEAPQVSDHDFPDPKFDRAIPYGIYDVSKNFGHVVIGTSHDTSDFAVNSIEEWWETTGKELYHDVEKIYMIADCGGSNGYRRRQWKLCLSQLATKIGKPIGVSHLPPGCSKWNRIEHRLFCQLTLSMSGRILDNYDTLLNLFSHTKTTTGLEVTCTLDKRQYPIGTKISEEEMATVNKRGSGFHPEWNYSILPNKNRH